MRTCGICGQGRIEAKKFCARCGTRFPDANVLPGAGAAPLAVRRRPFLGRYFAAINAHDYQAYVGLRSPQLPKLTVSQFDSGYGSTTDSAEMLLGVSSASNGDSVAHVTFTSRQSLASSATDSSCTAWDVSLYLVPDSGSYLIGSPPASYQAVSAVCQ
jgi:hypothetical protein